MGSAGLGINLLIVAYHYNLCSYPQPGIGFMSKSVGIRFLYKLPLICFQLNVDKAITEAKDGKHRFH